MYQTVIFEKSNLKILILAKKLFFRTICQCWQKKKKLYWLIKMSHTCRRFKKNLQIRLQLKWQSQFRHENIHFGNVGDQHRFWNCKIKENFKNSWIITRSRKNPTILIRFNDRFEFEQFWIWGLLILKGSLWNSTIVNDRKLMTWRSLGSFIDRHFWLRIHGRTFLKIVEFSSIWFWRFSNLILILSK